MREPLPRPTGLLHLHWPASTCSYRINGPCQFSTVLLTSACSVRLQTIRSHDEMPAHPALQNTQFLLAGAWEVEGPQLYNKTAPNLGSADALCWLGLAGIQKYPWRVDATSCRRLLQFARSDQPLSRVTVVVMSMPQLHTPHRPWQTSVIGPSKPLNRRNDLRCSILNQTHASA